MSLGEVQSPRSSFWVLANHSSLKHSQKLHTNLESSENTAKRSATHQCINPWVFIFIAFSNKIQWPIKVLATNTSTHHSNQARNEEGEGTPTLNLPPPMISAITTSCCYNLVVILLNKVIIAIFANVHLSTIHLVRRLCPSSL